MAALGRRGECYLEDFSPFTFLTPILDPSYATKRAMHFGQSMFAQYDLRSIIAKLFVVRYVAYQPVA